MFIYLFIFKQIALGCLVLLAYVNAGPVKAKEEAVEKADESEELDAEEEEDLESEGGAHVGRYIGGGDRDYDEYHGEEEAYEGKAGHEKAHKAGGVHSHHEHHDDGKINTELENNSVNFGLILFQKF